MNFSIGRRAFVRQAVTAVGGCLLADGRQEALAGAKARHCIFILMAGGPSQADTFDLEEGPWTPAAFEPATFGKVRFPRGLMPRIAGQLDSVSFLRGVRAPTTSHSMAQAGLPAFRSLGVSGEESVYGPRCSLLSAVRPGVAIADRARYGSSPFGDACLAARTLLRSGNAAQLIGITMGGWDSHSDIYQGALNPRDPNSVARRFDAGLGALVADLKAGGLLSETLVLAMGEFGRSPGPLNFQGGRDHHPEHAVLVAGAGIRGGAVIGFAGAGCRQISHGDIEATIQWTLGAARDPIRELWC